MEFLWGGRGWDDDESDFDTFGQQVSQSQMAHLQSEIARITVECQHWRELAQQRTHDAVNGDGETSLDFTDQLKVSLIHVVSWFILCSHNNYYRSFI
jgi:hypothetical protein